MSHPPAPFVPFTEHQDIPIEDCRDAFARVADRLDAGEEPRRAVDHLTRREMNHLSRLAATNRPLEPWIREQHDRRVAAGAIRAVCQ